MKNDDQRYSLRQFVLYQAAMAGTSGATPEETLRSYTSKHPDSDLDQELTFAQWLSRQPEPAPA